MYEYKIVIKSGTSGYFDEDGCDKYIDVPKTPFLPRIGETISIFLIENGKYAYIDYLVRDIRYWINENRNGIYLYVIQI